MGLANSANSYGTVSRSLHWIIAALIVVQYITAPVQQILAPESQIPAPFGMDKSSLLPLHQSLGMTVLMLMVLRLLWRRRSPVPALPEVMQPLQRRLAKVSHVAFYVILFAMPLSGWLMASAKDTGATWFGLWNWPNPSPKSDALFEAMHATHETLKVVLFFLALLHIAAALKHQFWNKDGVLVRMLPFGGSGAPRAQAARKPAGK